MRLLASLFVILAATVLQSAFSASLKSAEEEKKDHYDVLTELLKIDQLEFEAAQKSEEAHMNVTHKRGDDGRYLEAATDETVEMQREDSVGDAAAAEVHVELLSDTAEGGRRSSDAAAAEDEGANCRSTEPTAPDEQQQQQPRPPAHPESIAEDDGKDSTKEQDE